MSQSKARHYLTSRDSSARIAEQPELVLQAKTESNLPSVFIDPALRFQSIEGFGGAFTEAAASVLNKLSKENQAKFFKAYFDEKEGNGYSLCRVHINSCDFSLGNYAYTEVAGDTDLAHFSLERDRKMLLPMIKEGRKLAGGKFKLFASPWSPPAWMKTTGIMNHGGKLKPEYAATWAAYFVRYIQELRKEGIDIWGVTVQNEPAATQTWDSCIYTAEDERDFVRDHLGPALEKAGMSDIKIMIWDHNRDFLVHRAAVSYNDPAASKYIWGTGFHWYSDDKYDNLELHHAAWPDKALLFTEGCQEAGPHTTEWTLGERYARNMINDLQRWTVGWVDWNLLLDETGGPNHVGNLCSAPILADTKNDQLLFQNSYYYIGHFSRFIKPGAKRILCATTREALEATAFVNPDGSIAIVVLNRTELPLKFNLESYGWSAITSVPQRSIATFVIPA